MVYKKERKHSRLRSFDLFFFFLFRLTLSKQLLEKRCQKSRGTPYKHFHRNYPFRTNLDSTIYAMLLKKCVPFAKNLSRHQHSSACKSFIAERKTTLSFSWVKELSTCSSGTHSTCAISPSRAFSPLLPLPRKKPSACANGFFLALLQYRFYINYYGMSFRKTKGKMKVT